MVQSIQVDDDIYMMDQIYTPQFSDNTDILVDQVFLDMSVPSDHCLKDRLRNLKVDIVQDRKVPMKVVGLSHKAGLNQH